MVRYHQSLKRYLFLQMLKFENRSKSGPHQPLQCMTKKPLYIILKPDASPLAVHNPIPVPHHCNAKVKADLFRDIKLVIIEPVQQGIQVTWCSRMIIATKKDVSPRRTVDLQRVNQATLREPNTMHRPLSTKYW